ncbi:MAG TPA: glycosyltransferase, partial [bacterium]|nr:glycosyltransferase [bacterium]
MSEDSVRRFQLSGKITVSLVIPHFSSVREENLNGLLAEIREQTFKEVEIIIVSGVSPQGKAINHGARLAKGEILVVMDDDARMGPRDVIEKLVKTLRENPVIGMAGASVLTPESANPFQRKAATQFPRFHMPVVKKITDSDLACHGCVAFPMDFFRSVGMEREDILRGLDPDLRVRIRAAGRRVVLVPDVWVYHPLPASLGKFIRIFFRNGYGSAYMQWVHPELNYDTDEGLDLGDFVPKRSFFFRFFRFPFRLLQSLLTFQWIRFLGYLVYSFGYLFGIVHLGCARLGNRGQARSAVPVPY